MTLLTVRAAALRLGIPEKSLLAKAREHGHLIRFNRAVRLREDELEELIDKCRIPAKARASTPHTLKHTAITWAIEAGVSITDAAGFFGTSAETIERVYWHKSPMFQQAALDAMERRRK